MKRKNQENQKKEWIEFPQARKNLLGILQSQKMILFQPGFENPVRRNQLEKNEKNPSSNGEKKPRNHREASQRIKNETM